MRLGERRVGPGLETVVARVVVVGARVSALMVFAPFLASAAIAPRIKAGFTVVLTALLYPVVATEVIPVTAESAWRIVGGEIVIGLAMGLTLQFVFEGVQLAGQIIGFQVGYSLASLIDPLTDIETPVLSNFYQAVALLIFLDLDVHQWVLRGLAMSFRYCPPGTIVVTPAAAAELWRAAGGMLIVAVEIAVPALLATMLVDLALGLVGKASPQLPVLFVGLSIKSIVAFAVLVGALRFWPGIFEGYFRGALATTERLMHLVH
jgi:flagellar biosynthetic protein FliR